MNLDFFRLYSEAYSGLWQTSTMEPFLKKQYLVVVDYFCEKFAS